jgi:hypothetical protein
VEDERLAGTQAIVGQDDLELIAVVMRDEELELDRPSSCINFHADRQERA